MQICYLHHLFWIQPFGTATVLLLPVPLTHFVCCPPPLPGWNDLSSCIAGMGRKSQQSCLNWFLGCNEKENCFKTQEMNGKCSRLTPLLPLSIFSEMNISELYVVILCLFFNKKYAISFSWFLRELDGEGQECLLTYSSRSSPPSVVSGRIICNSYFWTKLLRCLFYWLYVFF